MAIAQQQLLAFDALLEPERSNDCRPNGLQATARFGEQELGFPGKLSDGGGFDGARDLSAHVAAQLGVEHRFIDIDIPA